MSRGSDKIYNLFMSLFEKNGLEEQRRNLLEDVSGNVLEIGFGTGANLKYYNLENLDRLTLLDSHLPDLLDLKIFPTDFDVRLVSGDVSNLAFSDKTFDSLVCTLVFCSVEDPMKGLKELYRVLKPGGKLYFIEHVLPTKEPYKYTFNLLTPPWRSIANGCHLNRKTTESIQKVGFELIRYHKFFNTSFVMGIGIKSEYS